MDNLKVQKKWFIASLFLFLLFFIGSRPILAEEDQSSPLFEESLTETLDEFRAGTKVIIKNERQEREVLASSERSRSAEMNRQLKTMRPGLCAETNQWRPTFIGSSTCIRSVTCWGVQCLRFPLLPTFIGTTCNLTCGVRSTCAGYICNWISPFAEAESQEKVSKHDGNPYFINLF